MLRNLDNYKEMHKEKAIKEGKLDALMACRTLTAARKLLWGEKKKIPNCSRCHLRTEHCKCK